MSKLNYMLNLFNYKFVWLFFAIFFVFSFLADLILWLVEKYQVPSWTIAVLSLVFAIICFATFFNLKAKFI